MKMIWTRNPPSMAEEDKVKGDSPEKIQAFSTENVDPNAGETECDNTDEAREPFDEKEKHDTEAIQSETYACDENTLVEHDTSKPSTRPALSSLANSRRSQRSKSRGRASSRKNKRSIFPFLKRSVSRTRIAKRDKEPAEKSENSEEPPEDVSKDNIQASDWDKEVAEESENWKDPNEVARFEKGGEVVQMEGNVENTLPNEIEESGPSEKEGGLPTGEDLRNEEISETQEPASKPPSVTESVNSGKFLSSRQSAATPAKDTQDSLDAVSVAKSNSSKKSLSSRQSATSETALNSSNRSFGSRQSTATSAKSAQNPADAASVAMSNSSKQSKSSTRSAPTRGTNAKASPDEASVAKSNSSKKSLNSRKSAASMTNDAQNPSDASVAKSISSKKSSSSRRSASTPATDTQDPTDAASVAKSNSSKKSLSSRQSATTTDAASVAKSNSSKKSLGSRQSAATSAKSAQGPSDSASVAKSISSKKSQSSAQSAPKRAKGTENSLDAASVAKSNSSKKSLNSRHVTPVTNDTQDIPEAASVASSSNSKKYSISNQIDDSSTTQDAPDTASVAKSVNSKKSVNSRKTAGSASTDSQHHADEASIAKSIDSGKTSTSKKTVGSAAVPSQDSPDTASVSKSVSSKKSSGSRQKAQSTAADTKDPLSEEVSDAKKSVTSVAIDIQDPHEEVLAAQSIASKKSLSSKKMEKASDGETKPSWKPMKSIFSFSKEKAVVEKLPIEAENAMEKLPAVIESVDTNEGIQEREKQKSKALWKSFSKEKAAVEKLPIDAEKMENLPAVIESVDTNEGIQEPEKQKSKALWKSFSKEKAAVEKLPIETEKMENLPAVIESANTNEGIQEPEKQKSKALWKSKPSVFSFSNEKAVANNKVSVETDDEMENTPVLSPKPTEVLSKENIDAEKDTLVPETQEAKPSWKCKPSASMFLKEKTMANKKASMESDEEVENRLVVSPKSTEELSKGDVPEVEKMHEPENEADGLDFIEETQEVAAEVQVATSAIIEQVHVPTAPINEQIHVPTSPINEQVLVPTSPIRAKKEIYDYPEKTAPSKMAAAFRFFSRRSAIQKATEKNLDEDDILSGKSNRSVFSFKKTKNKGANIEKSSNRKAAETTRASKSVLPPLSSPCGQCEHAGDSPFGSRHDDTPMDDASTISKKSGSRIASSVGTKDTSEKSSATSKKSTPSEKSDPVADQKPNDGASSDVEDCVIVPPPNDLDDAHIREDTDMVAADEGFVNACFWETVSDSTLGICSGFYNLFQTEEEPVPNVPDTSTQFKKVMRPESAKRRKFVSEIPNKMKTKRGSSKESNHRPSPYKLWKASQKAFDRAQGALSEDEESDVEEEDTCGGHSEVGTPSLDGGSSEMEDTTVEKLAVNDELVWRW